MQWDMLYIPEKCQNMKYWSETIWWEIIFIRYDDTEVCIKQRQWMYTLKNDITRMEEVQK